ncbi:DUF6308 family protein [Arthrobacter sp. efr-133-R2A-63]|uniref:DUF6308 family protein n=1 Tax=Arthrobacter sp. efr-133-R2A-63 TaxID=3040278 RepID=UPI00254C9ED3|nr:DUF6308 family protein [Arthrobacter sp. efr-133-R2A-63]
MTDLLTVGALHTSVDHAYELARGYLTEPGWSYPAYDGYPGTPDSRNVGHQDLLAPGLLNAGQQPLQTYYGFLNLLEVMNSRLIHKDIKGTLDEAPAGTLAAITNLYTTQMEDPQPQVLLTKMSKVLHRKRPGLLPLFDKYVLRAYSYRGHVPRVAPPPPGKRPDRAWVASWLVEVKADLCDGLRHWEAIAAMAPGPAITPLRAMDMVTWRLINETVVRPSKKGRRSA